MGSQLSVIYPDTLTLTLEKHFANEDPHEQLNFSHCNLKCAATSVGCRPFFDHSDW